MPTITKQFNERKHKQQDWITKGILKSINYKNKFTKHTSKLQVRTQTMKPSK
jgi:hypothetical protein